jgi:exosortase A
MPDAMDGGREPVVDLGPAARVRTAAALVIVDQRAAAWRTALAVLALGIAVVLLLCHEAALGAVRVWIESATFNHGFLIIPISLYMIRERRARWQHLAPQPAWAALVLLPALGFVYLAASVISLLEIQQFAALAIIETMILCVLGWRLFWAMLFPLLYLFFLVPSGEWLVPTLQDFTARFVLDGLELVGVPVFSDGTLISIPEADFRIAEACAGIRFLIASAACGCLFAELVYVSPWRRAAFIALSLIVPVFANGLRAFGIVMIAHWSNAQYAVGVDHVVYGWLFFSVVTAALMAVGWMFRDKSATGARRVPAPNAAAPAGALALAGVAAVALGGLAPAYAMHLAASPPPVALDRLEAPAAPAGWTREPAVGDGWRPVVVGADRIVEASYRSGARRVHLVIAFFAHQRQGAKAVSSVNRIADDETWQRISTVPMTATIDGETLSVPASRLFDGAQRLLAWQWYWIGGRTTANPVRAKLMQLEATLIERRRSAATIALGAPYSDDDPGTAAAALTAFMAARPDIADALRRAATPPGG